VKESSFEKPNEMSQPRLSVVLGSGRYAKIQIWQDKPRLDLREWDLGEKKTIPTKKGISLTLHQIKSLSDKFDCLDEALSQNEELKCHLGYNVFVSVQKDNPCVDIRRYWKPPNHDESVPTKKGLCLRPEEYKNLKSRWQDIENSLPELETFVLCYDRDNHLNQIGMLRCTACNPDDFVNW
jgi:hypothetical protein